MKLSNIATTPYRPQIKRLGAQQLPAPNYLKEFDCRSISSSKKWLHNNSNRVTPEPSNFSISHNNKLKTDSNKHKKKYIGKIVFCIIIAIILLLIIGAIIGIVLGLILPSSINTTSTTTLPSDGAAATTSNAAATTITAPVISCVTTGRGTITVQSGTTPSTWTAYGYLFTATKTASTILFGFSVDGTNRFYLDTVSVANTAPSSPQLLINPNFDNSPTTPTDWIISCEWSTCGINSTYIQTASSDCSSGYCLESFCANGRAALTFLSQTVTTINGGTYSITFMLRRTTISASGPMTFYLDVI